MGYGVKIFLPSPPNYVTRSPGRESRVKRNPSRRFLFFFLRFENHFTPAVTFSFVFVVNYRKRLAQQRGNENSLSPSTHIEVTHGHAQTQVD